MLIVFIEMTLFAPYLFLFFSYNINISNMVLTFSRIQTAYNSLLIDNTPLNS